MNKIIPFVLSVITLCIADQRHFVWTYEYKIVNRGEVEIEHYYTTSYDNASDFTDNTVGHELELEIGMNKRFDFAVYHIFEQQESLIYTGYKLRGRYRFGEQNQYFMDPLLYIEYHGKPDFSEHSIETKFILAKETERTIFSFNPVMEIEIEDGEKELELEYAAGLTYKINKLFYTGIEIKGSEYGHYWGPTISHGMHDIWFSLGPSFLIGNTTGNDPPPEMKIRMIMGVGIK